MSEEKLYVVKNCNGEFWDFSDSSGFWSLAISDFPTTPNKKQAELAAKNHGGHVVTFVEEPEKVVLTKEQAEIVERAHSDKFPAASIAFYGDDDEEPLMNAYVNGYTVAKEKKYNVKVPHTNHTFYAKESDDELCAIVELRVTEDWAMFSLNEIEHYGLQDCEKEEVTDDE